MMMEAIDFNSPSGKKLQTSNPPAIMNNQVTTETRILKTSPNSCLATEKYVPTTKPAKSLNLDESGNKYVKIQPNGRNTVNLGRLQTGAEEGNE